jgi:hypothetical protein
MNEYRRLYYQFTQVKAEIDKRNNVFRRFEAGDITVKQQAMTYLSQDNL